MKTNPIIYKTIKFQVAFFIDGGIDNVVVKMKQLTTLPSQKEFKNVKEARSFIKNIKEIL